MTPARSFRRNPKPFALFSVLVSCGVLATACGGSSAVTAADATARAASVSTAAPAETLAPPTTSLSSDTSTSAPPSPTVTTTEPGTTTAAPTTVSLPSGGTSTTIGASHLSRQDALDRAQRLVSAQNKPNVSVGSAKLTTINQVVVPAGEPPQPGGDKSVWAVSIIGGLDVSGSAGTRHSDWSVVCFDATTGQGLASMGGVGVQEAPFWTSVIDQDS
jgi:hypothetical protein